MNPIRYKSPTLSASQDAKAPTLKRSLGALDLISIGIATILGAGVFVVTGVAAATKAGPAIMLSFVLAACGCGVAGLCYSEFAAAVPMAGSAYLYTYVAMGEFFAWTVGWALILEYTVGIVAISVGWSGYFVQLLLDFDIHLPSYLTHGLYDGGLINLPAVGLTTLLSVLSMLGIKESARFASLLVAIKVLVVILFVFLGAPHVHPENWKPFMPYGWMGVLGGAGAVFYAYVGFDTVSTAAEETKNPQRNLALGTIGSLIVCTILYVAVAGVLTGIVPYAKLNHPAPVAFALQGLGITWGHMLVTVGAVAGLSSVALALMMGQPRILMAMARDGLLPEWVSWVHERFRTPLASIVVTWFVVTIGAATLPMSVVSEMVSIGTTYAFVFVCFGVVMLRKRHPELPRSFKVPFSPWLPIFGAALCAFIMLGLSGWTWVRFGIWMAMGLIIYQVYSARHSTLSQEQSEVVPRS